MFIKITSVVLTAVMALSFPTEIITPLAAKAVSVTDSITAESDEEFSKELGELLNEYETPEPFNKKVIDVEENTVKTDEGDEESLEAYGIDMQKAFQGNDYIPGAVIEDNLRGEEELNDNYISAKEAQSLGFEARYSGDKLVITKPFQTRRLIVNVKKGKLKNTFGAVKSLCDGKGTYILQYSSDNEAKAAYNKLKYESCVKEVQPEAVMTICAVKDKKHVETINSDRYIKYLSDNNKTSANVTVAVLDTGADINHPLIKNRIVKSYNIFSKNRNVKDGNGHGTHVCGIIANNTPSNVKIMPVKVMKDNGSGTLLGIKLGIEYAVKNGANIINMSLGAQVSLNNPITQAVKDAVAKKVTVVVSAGNESDNASKFSPANIAQCITVASSTDTGGATSLFSNYGSTVDITAPGENIESSVPNNGYKSLSGTSMACPFGAAAAAMVILDKGRIAPAQIESILKSYCADMYTKGNDIYSGAGLLNLGIPLGDSHVADILGCDTQGGIIELEYFKNCNWASVTSNAFSNSDDGRETSVTDRSYTVKNTNPSVATFNGRFVIPKGSGETVITLSMANKYSYSFKVRVKKIAVWTDYASGKFGGGNGTKKKPYLIKNANQLAKLSNDLRHGNSYKGKYFKLANDINLGGKMWISIAYCHRDLNFFGGAIKIDSFMGKFDGANHKIKNMVVFNEKVRRVWGESNPINENWYTNFGLFGDLSGATVKNLGIENGYTGNYDSGLLCGSIYEKTTIKNCYTNGESHGTGFCGCILNYNVNIKNCYSNAVVHKAGFSTNAYSSKSNKVNVSNCYFTGEIRDSSRKALTGELSGGFTNYIEANLNNYTNLTNCFAAVKSPTGTGFAVSNTKGNVKNCFYLKGNKYSIKSNNRKKKTKLSAKPKSFFKKKKNYLNTKYWDKKSPWNFKKLWTINKKVNSGFPYFKKNKPKTVKFQSHTGTWLDYSASSFAGGNGTKSKPYLIANAAQLARVASLYRFGGGKGVYFKLTSNIDLKAHKWFPISAGDRLETQGTGVELCRYSFYGNIDGNGRIIYNMTTSGGDLMGFVSHLESGSIKNLRFVNVNITAKDGAGAVAGSCGEKVNITNCTVSGRIRANNSAAGITSSVSNGIISNCESSANITSDFGSASGICVSGGNIRGCYYHSGKISAKDIASGISVWYDTIVNCLSEGYLLTSGSVDSRVKNSYSITDKNTVYTTYGRADFGKTLSNEELGNKASFPGFDFNSAWIMKGNRPIPKR